MTAPAGLIETLFSRRLVRMGPSRHDPSRQVATFDPDAVHNSRPSAQLRWIGSAG